ncbi:MAG: ABC transporter ATP-binding protein, partial [Bacteroidia bacterium]
ASGTEEKTGRKKAARQKRGLTFSEKMELEKLPGEIEALIKERDEIEKQLSVSAGSHSEIGELTGRLAELMVLTDSKELRWLVLSEKAEE